MGRSFQRTSYGTITQLPDDLLCVIYQKLNIKRDRKSFSRTFHRFLDIAILNCKGLDVTSNRSYNLDSLVLGKYLWSKIFRYFESSSSVTVIDFYGCTITDYELETLTKYCKTMTTVSLFKCSQITNVGICFLNKNCHKLRALIISGCDKVVGVSYQQGFSATLSYLRADSHVFYPTGFLCGGGLEYLAITYSHKHYMHTDERGLAAIGSGIAKNLKILSLNFPFVTDDCIIKISKGCPLLQELRCLRCKIGLPGWESIGLHCQYLERLHVHYCENLCDKGLLALGNCILLSMLYMTDCRLITLFGKQEFKSQRADVEIIERYRSPQYPDWTYKWLSWPSVAYNWPRW